MASPWISLSLLLAPFFQQGFVFTFNPSNYTYIPLKNNSYINIFPLKTNTFSLSFQLNNIIITFFSNFHSQPLSKYIKKL
ncbi:hypothetical protein Hanom_Chr17g01587091 [Helianthus anomalus]